MNQFSAGRAAFSNIVESLESRRLMAAGDLDSSFQRIAQSIALPRTDLSNATAVDVALDNAGNTVLFGNVTLAVGASKTRNIMYVARFLPDGSADLSFGSFGVQAIDMAAGDQSARAIAIDGAGRIDLAFDAAVGTGTMMQIAQLKRDGTLNKNFGNNGSVYPRFGPDSHTGDLAVDAENALVFSATAAGQVAVGKLSPSGRQHPDFGSRSTRVVPNTAGGRAGSIVVKDNGIFVGATLRSKKTVTDLAAIKLSPRGILDPGFGRAGITTVDVAGVEDRLDSLFIDSYGRIVMTGKHAFTPPADQSYLPDAQIAMARLLSTGALDPKFHKRGVASGAVWATSAGLTGHFATGFNHVPVLAVENKGQYVLTASSGSLPVSFGGRPLDVFHGNQTEDEGIVALTQRGQSVAFASKWRNEQYNAAVAPDAFTASVSTLGKNNLASVSLGRSVESPIVTADGRLVFMNVDRNNNRNAMRFKTDGQLDASVSNKPWLAGDDWYPAVYTLRESEFFAMGDGSVYMTYDGYDVSDRDSAAFNGWRFLSNGTYQHIGASGDETGGGARQLPRNHLTYVAYGLNSTFSEVVILSPGKANVGTDWYNHFEPDVPRSIVPGPPEVAVPIEGSTSFFVKGWVWKDDSSAPTTYYLVRVNVGTNGNTIDTTYAGGTPVTVGENFLPLFGQSSGALLYQERGVTGLRRLKPDGTPDNTFGASGLMATGFDHFDVDSKGRIIAWRQLKGGVADGDVQIARFSQNGKVDTTFGGGDGLMVVDTKTSSAYTPNVIVDSQDRLVVTTVRHTTGTAWSALRVLGD